MKQVVLASTSPYRKALMLRLGLPFVTARPEVDEEAYKARIADPVALVQALSRAKAEAVAAAYPSAVVIGSDQVAEIEGEVLGKPHTEERAVAQLMRFSGRTHRLVTGLAVWDGSAGRWHEHVNETRLVARNYDEAFARRYVERSGRSIVRGATCSSGPASPCLSGWRQTTRLPSRGCRSRLSFGHCWPATVRCCATICRRQFL